MMKCLVLLCFIWAVCVAIEKNIDMEDLKADDPEVQTLVKKVIDKFAAAENAEVKLMRLSNARATTLQGRRYELALDLGVGEEDKKKCILATVLDPPLSQHTKDMPEISWQNC